VEVTDDQRSLGQSDYKSRQIKTHCLKHHAVMATPCFIVPIFPLIPQITTTLIPPNNLGTLAKKKERYSL